MYEKILVPVDLAHEEAATRILALGKHLAAPSGKVVVLHVVPDIPTYVETYVPEHIHQSRMDEQRKKLEALTAQAGLDAEIRVVMGTPHIRILEAVGKDRPDLVVIGSHHPGLQDYFLGSTAARVVRHADCSVLVDR